MTKSTTLYDQYFNLKISSTHMNRFYVRGSMLCGGITANQNKRYVVEHEICRRALIANIDFNLKTGRLCNEIGIILDNASKSMNPIKWIRALIWAKNNLKTISRKIAEGDLK